VHIQLELLQRAFCAQRRVRHFPFRRAWAITSAPAWMAQSAHVCGANFHFAEILHERPHPLGHSWCLVCHLRSNTDTQAYRTWGHEDPRHAAIGGASKWKESILPLTLVRSEPFGISLFFSSLGSQDSFRAFPKCIFGGACCTARLYNLVWTSFALRTLA
jgi:hypothetical protein